MTFYALFILQNTNREITQSNIFVIARIQVSSRAKRVSYVDFLAC